ncbi:alpha-1,2-fucosyltransferase [Mesorhizobium sp. M0323]|uniref:alpha-1,2-fucosyltransferase n=1 Tax=Mesorhizobium sp. M0323 TaxID=2956938 RepID=UPI00333E0200
MQKNLYHLPVLSTPDLLAFRLFGPGLGNLLFPIARAVVGQKKLGGVMVPPTLRQIKFGTYARREPDKRTYGRLMEHRTMADWNNRFWSLFQRKVAEENFDRDKDESATIVYQGLGNFFHDIKQESAEICGWLVKRSRHKVDFSRCIDISVHVRRGDFLNANGSGANIQIPDEWYIGALQEARKVIGGRNQRCVIFTDGPIDQIKDLSQRLGAEVDASPNALVSLLSMSRGRIIITSRSTFSMWAVFLGDRVAIWDRTFASSGYWPHRPDADLVF